MRRGIWLSALVLLCIAVAPARAAVITIVNADTVGEGFNDPTPVAPVGGNPGVTLGQQRLNVFQQAASVWAALLPSAITIRVQSSFDPQTCTPTSAVLGSAGPQTAHRNFAGAEFPNTWYHQALANKQAGGDLSANDDIRARFNKDVDNPTCLGATNWYYGFDGNEGSNVDLFPVVLHELGHGLGFSTLVNTANGAEFNAGPDLFERFLFDASSGLAWTAMSNAQRAASAINTQQLTWTGLAANTKAYSRQTPRPIVTVTAPGAIAGVYSAGRANFGAAYFSPGVEGTVVQVADGAGTSSDGCTALTNGAAISGNIALMDRSASCSFTAQVLNAQNAGATAAIVINNVAGPASTLTGSNGSIVIPAMMVSQANGNTIRAQLGAGVVASVGINAVILAGMHNNGQLLMYAPNPLEPGSSVSHWDITATPNLLMEPALNNDLNGVDLTQYAFEDIGWLPRTTDVTDSDVQTLALRAGAPNPFRVSTSVRFDLARAGLAQLSVYDLSGRLVARLANGWLPAGAHSVAWDGTDRDGQRVPPGVYLSRLTLAGETRSGRLVRID